MSDLSPDSFMECRRHAGRQSVTFVCCHLQHGKGLGFFTPDEPQPTETPWPMAWCRECEEVRIKEGGWNDVSESFSKPTAMCAGCFAEIRSRNIGTKKRWWRIW
jgi:hypothetical protein